MLYLLLAIIAVGVLLMSEVGRYILLALLILTILGVLGYIAFGLIVAGWFYRDHIESTTIGLFKGIGLLTITILVCYWIYAGFRYIKKHGVKSTTKTFLSKLNRKQLFGLIASLILISITMILMLIGYFFPYQNNEPFKSILCPEAYKTEADRSEAYKRFITEVIERYPKATLNDFAGLRMAFLKDKGCQATLDYIADHRP